MNIFQEIGSLLKLKSFVTTEITEAKKMNGTKPGYQTTEFWLTLVGNLINVVGMFKGVIPPGIAAIVVAVLNGIYTIVRGFVKSSDNAAAASTPAQ